MKKPPPIPDWVKTRFELLKTMHTDGALGLISGRTIEGEDVFMLVGLVTDPRDKSVSITPVGHFVTPANPYEFYLDPSQEGA